MKKFLFMMMTVAVACLCITSCGNSQKENSDSRLSIKEAYDEICKLPAMKITSHRDSSYDFANIVAEDEYAVIAENLSREQIFDTGNALYDIVDRIGLEKALIGGTNQHVMSFYLAEKVSDDKYEVLCVAASGYMGYAVATYFTTDQKSIDTIRASSLKMQGNDIKILLEPVEDGEHAYITDIDVN